jgi:hypothetical protein
MLNMGTQYEPVLSITTCVVLSASMSRKSVGTHRGVTIPDSPHFDGSNGKTVRVTLYSPPARMGWLNNVKVIACGARRAFRETTDQLMLAIAPLRAAWRPQAEVRRRSTSVYQPCN